MIRRGTASEIRHVEPTYKFPTLITEKQPFHTAGNKTINTSSKHKTFFHIIINFLSLFAF
jgi:hypothetical protein